MKKATPKVKKLMKIKKLRVNVKTPLAQQLKKLNIITDLELDKITHALLLPKKNYWIYDVEDGEKMKGKSPNECLRIFAKQGRRGLNVYEVLAIVKHNPKVLKNHSIDCSGSRSESDDEVPGVYLRNGVQPRLGWFYAGFTGAHWGSASCLR